MAESTVQQIRALLAASHEDGERVLARANEEIAAIDADAARSVRAIADQRRAQIDELKGAVAEHAGEIELAYARMIEALARTSRRLVEIAREADFSPPPFSGGLRGTVELKLRETREVTFRFDSNDPTAVERGPAIDPRRGER